MSLDAVEQEMCAEAMIEDSGSSSTVVGEAEKDVSTDGKSYFTLNYAWQ